MYFKNQGQQLLDNGYLIVPIALNHKHPVLKNWSSARLNADHIQKYANSGIGVLTGQGDNPIVAFDIDTLNSSLADAFKNWCFDNFGATCERVGLSPKTLLVYRVTEPLLKRTSRNSNVDRLEVLGKGQQFVAYNVHPKTGKEYEWVDILGGISAVKVTMLPILTKMQIDTAINRFDEMLLEFNLANISKDIGGDIFDLDKVGMSLSEAENSVKALDSTNYDIWIRAGMALHHEFSGSTEALDIWDRWSSEAKNYKGRLDLETRWSGFTESRTAKVNAAWLIKQNKLVEASKRRESYTLEFNNVYALISNSESTADLINLVAPQAGVLADQEPSFTAELETLIRAKYKKLTGVEISASTLKTSLAKDLNAAYLASNRFCTEFANAERMRDRYGDGLLYDAHLHKWYIWSGIYWRESTDSELEELAKHTVEYIKDEAEQTASEKLKNKINAWYLSSQRAHMCRNMVSLLRSDRSIYVFNSELDNNSDLIATKNGTLNIRTRELFPSDPRYKLTRHVNASYVHYAKCPIFEQTVKEALNDDLDLIPFFKRLMGYILLGSPSEDIIILPYGGGSNGKSTIFNAINHTLGMYAKTASSDLFLTTGVGIASPGGAREDLLRLKGARFVYVAEPSEDAVLKEGIIKAMTGGDKIIARGLYSRSSVEFEATWTIVIPTNHKPTIKGYDYGIWRRVILLPFTRCFDNDPHVKKDEKRGEKLLRETDGILNWLVEGAQEYLETGLNIPDSIMKERDEYRSDMDLIQPWLDEHCEVSSNFMCPISTLYASWDNYAKPLNIARMIPTSISLSKQLVSKGFTKLRDAPGFKGIYFKGIRVRQDIFT